MNLHSEAQIHRKFVEMIKLLNIYLNHFPKHEKYGLCLQIRTAAYETYGFMIEAQKRYHKKTALSNLDVRHEQLRLFVNLAHELRYFQFQDGKTDLKKPEELADHRFIAISKLIDEIGRMIGGWIKSEIREIS